MKINNVEEMFLILDYMDNHIELLDRFLLPIVDIYLASEVEEWQRLKEQEIKNNVVARIRLSLIESVLSTIVMGSDYSTVDLTYSAKTYRYGFKLSNDGLGDSYRLSAKLDYIQKMALQENNDVFKVRFENKFLKGCPPRMFDVNKADVKSLERIADYLNCNNLCFYDGLGIRLPNEHEVIEVLSVMSSASRGVVSFSIVLECSKFNVLNDVIKPRLDVMTDFIILNMDNKKELTKNPQIKI